MKTTIPTMLLSLAAAWVVATSCAKTPAQEMADIGKKMPGVVCDKMLECTKPMIDKMPPSARGMLPPMMQSKEACEVEVGKEQKLREEKKEKITKEMVELARDCMAEFKKVNCADMQTAGSQPPVSCDKLSKLTKDM